MAADDLSRLTNWANGLLASMEPAARRQLAGEMARTLRASQAKRIRANIQPDGNPMAPRKPQPKLKKNRGRLRRKMFFKISNTTWLKARASEQQAVVEFVGTANRLATIHQYGLKDRIKGREISYPARELLGITTEEVERLEELLLAQLTKGL
ncbi:MULTISPECIES: phage virion morphogenesis protein [Aeromonas]|uniref:Phage virion morphogenesis protein n=1 Tax=Aeromonas dhakensis TaxID=196024 RepID=K1JH36_9GAMM|nr:phage virion morphogenesis protein [Aeromonas dhakensis]KMK98524.1 oxidoreductase [Aeromonas enteropelogenes]EKB25903.1 phage virion morphogenesis protein [Aeromonas dhakensis]MBF8448273.1 phage virion morphogenesis protein [Aeromonas dhakensis]TNI33145.1 phage virion morphogenesis protein [Aeromonas dhakensis]TNI49071.1 phage virion morphogenesis protein [Aeromonas dhakensis]